MSTPSPAMEQEFRGEYLGIARRYLKDPTEGELYQLSLLGRQLYGARLTPSAVAQLHFGVVQEILNDLDPAEHQSIIDKLSALLLEAMVIYGEVYREISVVLEELRTKYAELDRTKQELERSRDALSAQTVVLVQSEKLAALGELSAGVIHEINQPLNAMKIISQDVLRDIRLNRLEPGGVESSLRDVLEQVEKVSAITDHLRVYTRKTTGGQPLEHLDVRDPMEGVFGLIGSQLTTQGILVHKELSPGLFVRGDLIRLEQVLMNLVVNARDAVQASDRSDDKEITLRAYRADAPACSRRTVIIEVQDNGTGIPEGLLPNIFETFWTTKAPGRGTGLGLSVTKQIVEEHGGTIDVRSEVGVGTTFTLALPADEEG